MRTIARAAALATVAALALPGCIVAIDTAGHHEEEDEKDPEAARDADEAHRDERLLELEKRMERLEQGLPR